MTQLKAEDLGREDVKKLAQVLFLDINRLSEREAAANLINELPSYLRRSRILSLMVDKLNIIREPSKSACFTHKTLNREIIHALCGFIRAEVGDGLNGLVSRQTKLSIEQRRMLHNLRTVNGLWMTREAVERKYLIRPSFTWYYQSDGCEACMVGRFARDRSALTDMRTLLLSRIGRHRSRGLPPLMRWVEELMNCHGPSSLEMFVFSAEDALELKAVRRDTRGMLHHGQSTAIGQGCGLRRAESNATHRPARWTSVNTRRIARRPRSMGAIRRPDSALQPTNIERDTETDIIDCYLSRTLVNVNSEQPPAGRRPETAAPAPEPKKKPQPAERARGPEPEPEKRYRIERAERHHSTSSKPIKRSEPLKTTMRTCSEARRNSQIHPSRSLTIPNSHARTGHEHPSRLSQCVYRIGSSNDKVNQNVNVSRPVHQDRKHGTTLTRSQTTKTSKEQAAEYRSLLGEMHRPSCYSPSNYSRATLVEGNAALNARPEEKRPVSEATTHWSMFGGGDDIFPPIQPIPPLRIRKEKRKLTEYESSERKQEKLERK
ncbi:hypothetical protein MGYG_07265 [Nannizzia gypsea CBS 118893]|uniref:Uncharacterized protein n=1 Tax=Arthroderma gypseum (strain ATCC MYA-4604 / CBS 118893) TaxID=535722 RepID=E4V2J1_ARTGP|nr:hypothetical protein MGYG_07265 [Nannizzia gypsea CBS 118893]EFR04256.1 hypothetical protein MGYG_07265 [Nannizzia gypsea CBS 118893]